MDEVSVDQLQQAVEGLHECKSKYRLKSHVREEHEGAVVWEGDVYCFALLDHPSSLMAYAWSSPIEGSDKRKFYAVLNDGLVRSPNQAVRAAILNEFPPDVRDFLKGNSDD